MKTETKNTIIYKGITITLENGYYTFVLNGSKYNNTNIHMAKRMITRDTKN
jgi:hypothetical protein